MLESNELAELARERRPQRPEPDPDARYDEERSSWSYQPAEDDDGEE